MQTREHHKEGRECLLFPRWGSLGDTPKSARFRSRRGAPAHMILEGGVSVLLVSTL